MEVLDTKNICFHHHPQNMSDRIAWFMVRASRMGADIFFGKHYGARAVVLETVAAIPGMVGALFQHLRCLRWIKDDEGWIRTLEDEAENERVHLMVYAAISRISWKEKIVIIVIQLLFFVTYFLIYLVSSRTGHRIVGYLEEEAVKSYHDFLEEIESGRYENLPAPERAIIYWQLSSEARLKEVVIATMKDEILHRDTNHGFANVLSRRP